MWKLFCVTGYLFIAVNVYSVDEDLSPSKGDIHFEKIIFDYEVTRKGEETEFKLCFGEHPKNKDGLLWALSICSYGELNIKNKDGNIALVEMNTDYCKEENVSVFEFTIKNEYVDHSFFTLCVGPLGIKEQKQAIINKWENLDTNKHIDSLLRNTHSMYVILGNRNYIINLKDLIDDAKKKTSSETNKLEKTDR